MTKENEFNERQDERFNLHKKEFSLSELWEFEAKKEKYKYYRDEFIKEFIRRRNVLDYLLREGKINQAEYLRRRDKLAGEKLK